MFSSEEHKTSERRTYRIPACLSTEDKLIVLGPLSLTLRQAFLLTLSGSLTIDLWRASASLAAWGGLGLILRLVVAALPLMVGLVVAFASVAGRYLEEWGLVVGRYMLQPKRYRWQSLQDEQARRCPGSIRTRPTIVVVHTSESEDK